MYETCCQENKQWQENLACFHNGIAVFNFNLNWLLLWKKIPPKFILLYCLDLRLKKEITSSLAKSIAITLMRYLILSNPNIPKRVLLNKELFIQPSASSAKKKISGILLWAVFSYNSHHYGNYIFPSYFLEVTQPHWHVLAKV